MPKELGCVEVKVSSVGGVGYRESTAYSGPCVSPFVSLTDPVGACIEVLWFVMVEGSKVCYSGHCLDHMRTEKRKHQKANHQNCAGGCAFKPVAKMSECSGWHWEQECPLTAQLIKA